MEDRIGEGELAPAHLLVCWLAGTVVLWLFAFLQLPGATPEWLLRAQAACFGTTATGLPDPRGWALLTLAPLSLIAALIVAFYSTLLQSLRLYASRRVGRGVLLLLLVMSMAVTALSAERIKRGLAVSNTQYQVVSQDTLPENYPRQQQEPVDFRLLDQFGKEQTLEGLKGKVVLLTFAFSHCQTICPAVVKSSQEAQEQFSPEQVLLLLITLDPWRDTPSSLPTFAESWELRAGQLVLSGEVSEVQRVHQSFGMSISRDEKSGDIVHPPLLYVVAPDGKIVYSFNNPSPTWIVDAINRVLKN